MSLTKMFNIGLHGLSAHATAMNVVGDNIANVNTIGFKTSRANFQDMVAGTLLGAGSGSGVAISSIQRFHTQGALAVSQSPLDLALSGGGFFVVHGQYQGNVGTFFSRAGQFAMDTEGYVVNDQGLRLQAFELDATTGRLVSRMSDLRIPQTPLPPKVTENIKVGFNLDQRAEALTGNFDPDDAAATSNFNIPLYITDSLGVQHEVTVYFRKNAANPNEWSWYAVSASDEVDWTGVPGGNPNPGGNTIVAEGAITFTSDGLLEDDTNIVTPFVVDWRDASPNQAIAIDFGDSIVGDGGTGLKGATQFAAPNTLNTQGVDGYPVGELESIEIDTSGVLHVLYNNGQRRQTAQIAIARFNAEEGLSRIGGSLFSDSPSSGAPTISVGGEKGTDVISGSLEQSNVDLAREFINLITEQRAYQASSRTVTTADEVLQETMNLKR